jgi:hypothetical protein
MNVVQHRAVHHECGMLNLDCALLFTVYICERSRKFEWIEQKTLKNFKSLQEFKGTVNFFLINECFLYSNDFRTFTIRTVDVRLAWRHMNTHWSLPSKLHDMYMLLISAV